jgi:hypothetical protein
MTFTKIIAATALVFAATVGVSALGIPSPAQAQSAYTTGTIASSERAGYPSPEGYGPGLYAYAQAYRSTHVARERQENRQEMRVQQSRIGVDR